jgi:hypothetical protein
VREERHHVRRIPIGLGALGRFTSASLHRSAREESPLLASTPKRFADDSRKLTEAEGCVAMLVTSEYGHRNTVGQTQCGECGERIPQMPEARWALANGK